MKYRSEIDGLRTVAVVPVVLFHAGLGLFSGGFVGVDVFFVISGFLITTILLGDLEAGRFSILTFYERRARRILPALFVVLLVCLPFAWAWMLPSIFEEFARSLIAVALFFSNVLFWRESGYFAPAAEEKPLLHTWSLAVEEQYYLIFPLLLWALWRWRRERLMWVVVALAAASLGLNLWAQRNDAISSEAVFYLTPTRAWELLVGSLCAFHDRPERRRGSDALAGLGMAMIVLPIFLYDATTPFPGLYALPPVLGTALVLLFARGGTRVARLLSVGPVVGIGLISYSVYLWHQPLLAFARLRSPGEPPLGLMLALAAASLLLGYLSWRFVEQPFRRGKLSLLPRRGQIFAFSGAGMAAAIGLGAVGIAADGFSGRMPPAFFEREAVLAAAEAERFEAIGQGTCHYNRMGERARLDDFLGAWTCGPEGPGPVLALYGDSHAADKAAVLRLAGMAPLQMTGAGCPLLPASGGPSYCDTLLAAFVETARAAGAERVVLANRFETNELAPAYLSRLADFWTEAFDEVYLFSPMPEFPGLKEGFLLGGLPAVAALHPETAEGTAFADAAARADLGRLAMLPTEAYFCADRPGCGAVAGDALLLLDPTHLTRAGAARFAKALRTAAPFGTADDLADCAPDPCPALPVRE